MPFLPNDARPEGQADPAKGDRGLGGPVAGVPLAA